MTSLRSTHSFLFLAATVMLSSCGGDHSRSGTSNTLYSTSAEMSAVQDLTTEERAIATRICYAYQSKNTNFRTQPYLGGLFSFSVTANTCDTQNSTYAVPSVLSVEQSVLYFKANASRAFVSSIQTNEYGFLSQLCSKIQANLPISNTTAISQTKIQVNFFKDGLDNYTLKYFSMTTNKIQSAETFQVRTQFNINNGQILGMDEKYSRQETCIGDSTKFSQFTQNFSGFTAQ